MTTTESDISDLYVIVLNFFVLLVKEKVQTATRKRTYTVKKIVGLNMNCHRLAVEWLGTSTKKTSLGLLEAKALQKATDFNSNAAIRIEMLTAWKFLMDQTAQSHVNRSLFLQRGAEGAVPSMLTLLKNSLTDFNEEDGVEVVAISVVTVLSGHDDGRSALIAGGFVSLLVDILSNVNDAEIVNIVRTLHHLTAVESYRPAVKSSGAVAPLRAILNQLMQTHETKSAYPVETAVNCATVLLFVGDDSDARLAIAAVEKILETRQGLSQITSSALIAALVRIASVVTLPLPPAVQFIYSIQPRCLPG